ncbi:MAG: helix-turn-helix domain-containing protein [Candidatus Limnocylindrales bacterium]
MTERELDRRAAHRLAVIRHAQEVTHNVSKTCHYYGISRQAYYKWLRRYEAEGLAGLRDGRPTTSVPTRSRCTCAATTRSRLARRGSGGSCAAST